MGILLRFFYPGAGVLHRKAVPGAGILTEKISGPAVCRGGGGQGGGMMVTGQIDTCIMCTILYILLLEEKVLMKTLTTVNIFEQLT